MCDRRVRLCAIQERLLLELAATRRPTTRCMQKEQLEFIKVRPRTAIERAPSLCTATHDTCTTAYNRTVRLRQPATQADQPQLLGVQRALGPCYYGQESE